MPITKPKHPASADFTLVSSDLTETQVLMSTTLKDKDKDNSDLDVANARMFLLGVQINFIGFGGFHPDTPFNDYMIGDEAIFDQDTADFLDARMDEAFNIFGQFYKTQNTESAQHIMLNQNDNQVDNQIDNQIDNDYTFVVLNNEWNQNNSRDLIGNIYRSTSMVGFLTSGLPSYTDVTIWRDLVTTSFMLHGITVEDGHAGMSSVQLEAIIKSLNCSANYEYTLSVKASENTHTVLVGVVETDVFTISAFCFGIQLAAGWDCGELNSEDIKISDDDAIFEINVPISWVPGK